MSKEICVVTGVGPGTGSALVRKFAERYRVVMIARYAQRLDELNSQLANQSNEEQALLLIKEMERVKQETELDMLRLQANSALARGDQATADEINHAITSMTTPRPARPAVERTASAGSGR